MSAVDAFTLKAAAFKSMRTKEWTLWVEGYTASLRGESPGTLGVSGFTEQADEYSHRLANVVSLAETFYVSPEMNALVTAAAEGWEADEPVLAEDFPTDHGWLYIPGGIGSVDIRGSVYVTSVLTWARRAGTVEVTYWADKRHDPPRLKEQPGWAVAPQMTPWHHTDLVLGKPLPVAISMGRVLPPEVSQEIQWFDTGNGYGMSIPQGWTPEELTPKRGPDPIAAWLVSALRIMQQPLAKVERQGLPASVRKAAMKHPVRVKNMLVTVIQFRRAEGFRETGTGREFSHRFLRRGHWRKQWVGSERTGDRRQVRIWIHPQIVGPADKPLILHEHVNALCR